DDDTVSGLTTAAIVWGAAGIGVATGAGFYAEAITGVVLLLVSIEVIPVLIKRLTIEKVHRTEHTVQITLKNEADLKEMIDQLKEKVIEVKDIQLKDLNNDEHVLSALNIVDDSVDTLDMYQCFTY